LNTPDPVDLNDGVVQLREWADDDAGWYAEAVRDPLIQRFTTDPADLDAQQVLEAIVELRASSTAEGFVICDAATGQRLGNIALSRYGRTGEVSYWVAAGARGRGVATRALSMFSRWSFRSAGLEELWLCAHRDNVASQRVAARAGYLRDPRHDKSEQAKGEVWPMLGFTLRRGHLRGSPGSRAPELPSSRWE
jgi:ribosomal-protein-alanine N-acetyltransferase